MQLLKLNEGTAARRRIPVALVDDTDGKTAETGVTLSAGDLKISKNGAAEANHAGTLAELAGGDYYYEATSGELDTVGYLTGRLVKSGVRTFRFAVQVVAFDPYDGVRAGLTALPNAAAEAAGGLYTRGSGAGQIAQSSNGLIDTNPMRLNNVAQSLQDLQDFADAGYDPATNKVTGVVLTDTVTSYTGNTPQTGDAFARLGTPAGASVSADIAGVQADTDNLQTRIPAALVGGRIDASVGAMALNVLTAAALATDAVTEIQAGLSTLTAANVNAEVLDVLNVDTFAEPGQNAPAATTSLAAKINYLYKAWRNRSTQSATTYSLYADNATTVDQKSTVSDSGTVYDRGEVASGP